MTALWINGIPTTDLHRYALRWVERPGQAAAPELYRDGHRVVAPWRLELVASVPADPAGGNANTEG